MQIGRPVATRFALWVALTLAVAAPVRALPVSLQVLSNGASVGLLDETALGCADTSGVTAACQASNLSFGGITLSNVTLNLDSDPVVSAEIAVQNMLGASQHITLLVTLPISAVLPSSLTGGSVAGGVTDNNGDGATLSTVAGSAFYTALIDGVTHQMLFPHSTVVSVVNPYESADTGSASFGLPGVTLPGPAANANIGIRLDFELSGNGDAASFTSVFVVQPIPEPGTAMLLGLGLGVVGWSRRRRLA